ncbi:hypothetical protein DE146DRAFT_150655 [Phaeosphaeria sp. MPI-PUGE-AT-0046c]|nr:hypothetical protein DE146DRAFT_150655 [Phaeosphaeria sp. MPI-PUGE-AT-0046c]
MSALLHRLKGDKEIGLPPREPADMSVQKTQQRQSSFPIKDVNVPKKRLQIYQKCLYERTLPGNAFISAHVNRLQHGYYESSAIHEDVLENVYFVSVHFVFHPHDPRSHRFKSADIRVCVHGDTDAGGLKEDRWYRTPASHPRILKHAPELMFGAVSPESLQWNFSLSSSLGISQAPVSATVNPTGGMKGSYKVFHMMSVQGSVRSQKSPLGPEHDIEDGMAVWTLEENMLQRSGLPRDFDFVLLIHKPDDVKNVYLTVDVDAEVDSWFGSYPQWYTNLAKYMPTQDMVVDFNTDIGQRFLPAQPGRGFNFGSLPHPLDEYVMMPGTVYPTNDTKGDAGGPDDQNRSADKKRGGANGSKSMKPIEASPTSPPLQQHPSSPQPRSRTQHRHLSPDTQQHSYTPPEQLNVRVVLEHQYPTPPFSNPRRYSYSPLGSNFEPARYPSIRRRKSRTGLKDFGARQALRDTASEALDERARDREEERGGLERLNGQA